MNCRGVADIRYMGVYGSEYHRDIAVTSQRYGRAYQCSQAGVVVVIGCFAA